LFKNYDAFKFKDDFLAGLTLASLSIPQVYIYIHIFTNITFLFLIKPMNLRFINNLFYYIFLIYI
jgi:hypothetical protein